ncbi:unnamed protein product [Closterium sp. NIES-65]|nr:unnamed protein product [Closterium sp. NIES-65]
MLPATCGGRIVAGLPPLHRPTRTSSHRTSPSHFNVSSAGRVLSYGRNLSAAYQLASLVPLPLIAHAASASAKLQRNAALTSRAVARQSDSSQPNASQNKPASFTLKAASAAVAAAVAAATSAISAFTSPAALAVDSDALSRYEQIAGKAVQRSVVTITSAAATGPVNATSAGEAAGAAVAGSAAGEAASAVASAVSDAVSAAAPAAVTEAASAAASAATSAVTSAAAGVADLFTSAVPAAASAAVFDAEVALAFAAAAGATALLAGAFSFLTRKQYAGDLTPEAALEKALEEAGEEWEEEGEAVVLLDIRDGKEKSRSGNPTLKNSPKRLVAVAYREDSVKRKPEEGEGDGEDDVVIELGDRKEGFLDAVKEAKAVSDGSTIIVIDKAGEDAVDVAKQLTSAGFKNVFVVAGGADAWQARGLPWKKPFLRLPTPVLPSLPSLPSFNLGINLEESVSTVKEVFTTVESGASKTASAAASAAPAALGILAAAGLSVAVLAEAEALLTLVASVALVQFIATKLLFAKGRPARLHGALVQFIATKLLFAKVGGVMRACAMVHATKLLFAKDREQTLAQLRKYLPTGADLLLPTLLSKPLSIHFSPPFPTSLPHRRTGSRHWHSCASTCQLVRTCLPLPLPTKPLHQRVALLC